MEQMACLAQRLCFYSWQRIRSGTLVSVEGFGTKMWSPAKEQVLRRDPLYRNGQNLFVYSWNMHAYLGQQVSLQA